MRNFTLGDRLRLLGKAAVGVFSEQSIRAAYGLLAGVYPSAAGEPPKRGTGEQLLAYNTMPWLRAVTSRISAAVASIQWELFVAKAPGQPARQMQSIQRASYKERRHALKGLAQIAERQQIHQHPLLDLLNGANPYMTGQAMRRITQVHLDIVGEAFWLKERSGLGMPVAVWPIPPNWVLSTPTPRFRFFRVQFRGWHGNIPDTEVLWFTELDPSNPYGRGTGTAATLSDELETHEYTTKHVKSFFYNHARPDFMVSPKGDEAQLKEGEAQRFQNDWVNRHGGFWRAFKPYFASRPVEIHEFAQNFQHLQLTQLLDYERNTIIQVFGMPPEMLGVLEHSNRATIDTADFLFARWVLLPRLEFLRATMQERLVPEFDERLILDYVTPIQEDNQYALDVAKAMPAALSIDEWRAMGDKPPLLNRAGEDLYPQPLGTTFGPLGEPGMTAPPPAMPPGTGPGTASWDLRKLTEQELVHIERLARKATR